MQQKPSRWPDEGDVEMLPEIFLRMPGSTWPPSRDGVPAGSSVCGSWSISRTLTGGFLPGQVRGVSGYSIASANVVIPQAKSQHMSPWAPEGWQVSPGGAAQIYASHDGADGGTAIPLGSFQVEPISGSPSDIELNLDLTEDSRRLKRPVAIKWAYTTPSGSAESFALDASWVLDQIARAGGYYSTPKPDSNTVLSVPLVGGPSSDRGTTTRSVIGGWRENGHRVGLSGISSIDSTQTGTGVNSTFYLSAQVALSGGLIRMGDVIFEITPNKILVWQTSTLRATIPLPTAGLVKVLLRVTKTSGGLSVRASSIEGVWTADYAVTVTGQNPWSEDTVTISSLSDTGFIRAVRLDKTEPTTIWGEPTALIDLADSPIRGIFDNEKRPAWDLAQEVAASTLGGLWISETGVFTYRSRHSLRGIGDPVEEVEALDQIEKLTWKVDPADIADRVEVSYIPTEVRRSNDAITLWEATHVIVVRQRTTQVVYADIEGTTDRISPFVPIWDESTTTDRFSRWAASNSREAGGQPPADGTLRFSTKMVGPSRVKISIENTSGTPVWMVDGNGNPLLTLRTSVQVAPGETASVEQGLGEEDAIAPLSVDCGASVQDHATAVELCAWLEGQTRVALPIIEQVRVKPNLRRQLGDVIRLKDGISSLSTKAIVTGITLGGDALGYSQSLDLALLTTTFVDIDNWLEDHATFASWDAWITEAGIPTFYQLDSWIDALGRE